MLTQLRASYLTIFNLRESTLIRSTSDGIVAKVLVQNIQTVEKGQTLLTFISDQTSFLVKISVPTSKISKVSPANDVKIAIDSFPFQRYGNFTGKVISVDRLPASDQRDVYFVKSTLIPPRANGGDLATIQLLPGMKATVYIRSRKLSVWQMVFEKVFANEYL